MQDKRKKKRSSNSASGVLAPLTELFSPPECISVTVNCVILSVFKQRMYMQSVSQEVCININLNLSIPPAMDISNHSKTVEPSQVLCL